MSLPRPPQDWLLILDFSQFNGRIPSVQPLLEADVSALSIRAVDGEHDVDKEAANTAALCRAAGLDFQVYGPIENYGPARARGQALRLAQAHIDLGATFLPAMDWELPVHPEKCSLEQARACIAAARVYVETVAEKLGALPLCYTGAWFLDTLERIAGPASAADLEAIASCEGWISDYGDGEELLLPDRYTARVPHAYRGHDVRFWQAGPAKTALPWAPHGKVDIDWFRGTREQLPTIGRAADVAAIDVRQR
jgi:GH25 family lysozyme M1 (1,4-beta-N-acetylmuramidase)